MASGRAHDVCGRARRLFERFEITDGEHARPVKSLGKEDYP
jgi:hypothetical protein